VAAALCFGTISRAAGAPAPATTATVTIESSPGNGLVPFAPPDLTGANLAGANLSGAILERAISPS
jgi:hypothetical protein